MDSRQRQALDNYIMGKYNPTYWDEDESDPLGHAFTLGIEARKAGKDATTTNPFLSRMFRKSWIAGWADEDMSLHEWSQK